MAQRRKEMLSCLLSCSCCRYAFKEEEEPENFFVPYTYQLVLQRVGSLPWDARALGVLSGTADDAVEIVYAEDDADV